MVLFKDQILLLDTRFYVDCYKSFSCNDLLGLSKTCFRQNYPQIFDTLLHLNLTSIPSRPVASVTLPDQISMLVIVLMPTLLNIKICHCMGKLWEVPVKWNTDASCEPTEEKKLLKV